MKLATFACTVFFIIISGNCGLVKDLFGKVHEDVHTALGKAVSAIGTVAHKVHEPFGVYLHGDKKNFIPDTEQSTISIVEQTSANNVENVNTESSYDNGKDTTKPEKVSYENKDTQTNRDISGNNEVKLENILPLALYNDTYFKETDPYAIPPSAVRGSFPNTGNSTKELSKSEENNNGKTKLVEPNGGPSNETESKQNFISDQVVFPDNKNIVKREIIECSKGRVKSADGKCLKSTVFEAYCPKGQRRALDGSCQTDLGWSN